LYFSAKRRQQQQQQPQPYAIDANLYADARDGSHLMNQDYELPTYMSATAAPAVYDEPAKYAYHP